MWELHQASTQLIQCVINIQRSFGTRGQQPAQPQTEIMIVTARQQGDNCLYESVKSTNEGIYSVPFV